MDINLESYKTFYYVCELKNITKVAEKLYVTQPAITKQIKKLEESLGKSLIVRSTRGIELTKDGQKLYEQIKNPIESLLYTENNFKEKIDNYEVTIKILAGQFTIKKYLLKAMSEFNKIHPKTKFGMSSVPFQNIIQEFRTSDADLVIFSSDELTEEYNDIIVKPFCELHDIFVASKAIKDKFPDKINLFDLNKYPIICQTENRPPRKLLDNIYDKANIPFFPTYELSNYWLIDEYIRLGLGIGMAIKEYTQEKLQSGEFVQIQTDVELPPRQLCYAVKKNCASYGIIKEFLKKINIK